MATISSAGIGSGLDVESIVTALVAVERKPIDNLQTQASGLEAKLSSFGKIKSYMSALRDAAQTLSRPATWAQTTGSSSNAAAVSVSTGSNTLPGNYSVEVSSLAASQSVATTRVYADPATDLVGAGTLHFEIGTWSGSSFGTPSASYDVTLEATDTLETARDKINAAGGGVVASILSDSSGSRLVLRSRETGAANGFRVTATGDADGSPTDNAGISALSYTSPTSTTTELAQSASNAVATINNLTVTSAGNTLSEVIDGITLTLNAETTAPVEVSATLDKTSMRKSIDAFVAAYNQLASYLTEQTKYDESTKTAGTLQGDNSVVSIRNQMRSMLSMDSTASSMFGRLSDVGFDIQADGTIKLQSAKIDNALANVDEMKKLFANADSTDDSKDGVMVQLRRLADDFLGFDGAITARSESLQRRIDGNEDQQAKMEERVAEVEKRLRAQYTSLDTRMAQLSSLSSYISQQIAMLNSSS